VSRIVNVSNRVALPRGSIPTGGLAVGLLAAMEETGGLWFGWSGDATVDPQGVPEARVVEQDGICFATIPLPEQLHELCYSGFANGSLWPLFHSLLDGFRYADIEYEAYLTVNELFAQRLRPLLRSEDVIWVHDYHLFPLAAELRKRGVGSPLGFFLHIPFPGFELLRALPRYECILRALTQYDLVGFQTETDRRAFIASIAAVWGEQSVGVDGTVRVLGRVSRTGVFPIGVDPRAVNEAAAKAATAARVRRMTEGLLGRRLIIGVDRLDYSKGLLERFEGFRSFLEQCPQHHGQVTYLQIASLGRQNVKAYSRIRHALEQTSGRTNGAFADVDWTPIRYLNRNIPHATLMGFLRVSDVCLVTPVRDGMNLVAKEFVAAQDPWNPGVLVLSDRTGAAYELTDSLLVNPYDTQGIANAIQQALEMPLSERRARHEKLMNALRAHDLHAWHRRFIATLRGTRLTPSVAKA
jgi:trehalose 6-phosphate synthase